VLGTLGAVGIVFGATEGPAMGWTNPFIIGSIAAGLLLLAVFVLAERNAENPLLPLSLFGSRDQVATFVAILLAGGAMGAMTFYVAQFLQNVLGYSTLTAGIASIPFTVGVGVGGALSSKLATLVQPRWILSSSAVVLAAALLYGSTLDRTVSYFPTLLILLPLIGFGIGIVMVVVPLCLLVDVPASNIGPLTAIGQMAFNLGGPIAIGLLSPIALSRTLSLGGRNGTSGHMTLTQIDALSSGYTLVLFICAIVALIIALIVVTLSYTPQQLAQAQQAEHDAQQS
jgi:predicted MFS family arabinose efflux permease